MNTTNQKNQPMQLSTATASPQEEFITTRKAANILGVTVRTIQNWVDSNKLYAKITLGGHRRLLRSEVEALITPNAERPKLVSHVLPAQKLRVLVVEDNPDLLNLYKLRFSTFALAHELYTATDGIEGIFKIGRHMPHLLVMDLRMPNFDGFQMLRSLQNMSEASDLKVIAITGISAAEILEGGGLPLGVALLPKPVPFDTLEALCMQRATELGLAIKTAS